MGENKQERPVVDECPRCGWRADGSETKVDQDQVREYLRSVMSGTPFAKMYELYGGEIKLWFKALNNEEVDRFNTLAYRMSPVIDELSIRDAMLKLKILYYLEAVEARGKKDEFEPPKTLAEVDDIGAEFTRRFGEYPELITRAMAQSLFLFEELQRMVTEAAFDENFWKGAGLR